MRSLSRRVYPYAHWMQPGDHRPRRRVGIFDGVRIMPSLPSFSSISPIYCKTSCPKHDVKRHNYALTITTTTRGTCLWSRYPVLVKIRELEVLNFKALCCQLTTIGDSGYQQHGMSTLSQRTSSTTNTLLP